LETLVSALQRKSFDVIVNGLEPDGRSRATESSSASRTTSFNFSSTVRRDDNPLHSLDDCQESRRRHTRQHRRLAHSCNNKAIPYRSYADPVGAYRDLELETDLTRPCLDRARRGFLRALESEVETCWATIHARSVRHRPPQRRSRVESRDRPAIDKSSSTARSKRS
jgi:hypothetical protein